MNQMQPIDMAGARPKSEPFVKVKDLRVKFVSREATVQAVNGVSFELQKGEVLCVIGESGSGKSVMMRSMLRLHPKKRYRPIASGAVPVPVAIVTAGIVLVGSGALVSMLKASRRASRGTRLKVISECSRGRKIIPRRAERASRTSRSSANES